MSNSNHLTTPSGGEISIGKLTQVFTTQSVNTEHRLHDFLYGGSIVKANECTGLLVSNSRPARWRFNGIPAHQSTPKPNVKLSDFWGKGFYHAPSGSISVSGSAAFYSTRTAEDGGGKNIGGQSGKYPAFFTLVAAGERKAGSITEYAFRINQENGWWESTVVFKNNGQIKGKGGRGGNGNNNNGKQNGGPALRINAPAFFYNQSGAFVYGGGAGGNSGGSSSGQYKECYCCNNTRWSAGGNGGGGGAGAGQGGSGGGAPGGNFNCNGNNGNNGNWSGPGGQVGNKCCNARAPKGSVCTNAGTAGGNWGSGKAVVYPSKKYYTTMTAGATLGGYSADGVTNLNGGNQGAPFNVQWG